MVEVLRVFIHGLTINIWLVQMAVTVETDHAMLIPCKHTTRLSLQLAGEIASFNSMSTLMAFIGASESIIRRGAG